VLASYEIRVAQAGDGFVVEVRRDGVIVRTTRAVSIENVAPCAAGNIAADVAARLDEA
jgi:hypothetical protein